MRRTSLADIRDALQGLALPRDRVVIVHSSLVKFGLLEGGAAGLLDVLRDTLGPDATIVMPAFTFAFGESRIWHAAESKSEAGALTEFFRKRPGVKRSLHPFHSVCAEGPLADTLVAGHSLSSFGPESAFDRLYAHDALNLSVGTEFVGGATFLHMGEERARVPYRYIKDYPGEVRDSAGDIVGTTFTMYSRIMTQAYEYVTDWNGWWLDLNDRDRCRTTDLRGAKFHLWDIRKTLAVFQRLLLEDPFRHSRAVPRSITP